jgi:hypothetical protein
MKKLTTSAVLVLFALGATAWAQADKAMIEAKEKAAWQAFKDKDAAAFQKIIDKDLKAVYAEGIADMTQELADMKKWDMKSFTFSDFKAFSDEKDVIVTTYTVKVEGTYDGKDKSGTYNAGSVWKKEGNDWLGIFHCDAKQEAAAK